MSRFVTNLSHYFTNYIPHDFTCTVLLAKNGNTQAFALLYSVLNIVDIVLFAFLALNFTHALTSTTTFAQFSTTTTSLLMVTSGLRYLTVSLYLFAPGLKDCFGQHTWWCCLSSSCRSLLLVKLLIISCPCCRIICLALG